MSRREQRAGFDHAAAGREARRFFNQLWAGSDPWDLDTSDFEQRRYARQLALLAGRRYRRALEIGCAGGSFTRQLLEDGKPGRILAFQCVRLNT